MAKVEECLPSMCKAQGSIPSTLKKKNIYISLTMVPLKYLLIMFMNLKLLNHYFNDFKDLFI
jgi:hypothetical protein